MDESIETDEQVREYLCWIDKCRAVRWRVSYKERMKLRAGSSRAWDEGLIAHDAEGWQAVTEKGRAFLERS
jgi:L-fucose isomerase-like protein